MTTTLDLFREHVVGRGWRYEKLDDATLRVDYDLGWTRYSAFVRAPENYYAVSISALYPVQVTPDRLTVAMEYITRANRNVEVGHWELDLGDGTVAFRVGMWRRDVPLTHQILLNLFHNSTDGYQMYVRGLEAVIAGIEEVQDAIDSAEGR